MSSHILVVLNPIWNCFNVEIIVLEDNRELESALQKIKMPTVKINKFEVDGISKYSQHCLFLSLNLSVGGNR